MAKQMVVASIKLTADLGPALEPFEIVNVMTDISTLSEYVHRIDVEFSRIEAERQVLSKLGRRPSSSRLLAERYLLPNQQSQIGRLDPYLYDPPFGAVPNFSRIVSGYLNENMETPDQAVVKNLSYKNPFGIELAKQVGEIANHLAQLGIGLGGFAILAKMAFGSGPEERANANIKNAIADKIREAEPSTRGLEVTPKEISAIKNLKSLGFILDLKDESSVNIELDNPSGEGDPDTKQT